METRFELTVHDFAEALNASQLEQRQKGFQTRTSKYALIILLAVVFGFLAFLLWQTHDRRVGFDFEQLADEVVSQGPWIVLGALFILQMQATHMSRRASVAWLLVIAALICALAMFGAFVGRRQSGYPLFSWSIIALWWWAFWQVLVTNTSHRAVWRKATNFHGPKLLAWTSESFVITDDVSELTFKWVGLRGWQETHSLVLLWISDHAFFIIPKRAFANDALWNELCRLAAVATDVSKQRGAFPVIPLEPTAERK